MVFFLILSGYGGVYMDTDHLLLRSIDSLLNESTVIGTETKGVQCGNGFLIAKPHAPFLSLWLANYTDFNDAQWATHSTVR
jgi:mannosyltransferase OCH1-like enzyme